MRARDGFTMIELLVALVVLAVAVVGLSAATGSYSRLVTTIDRKTVAAQVAKDRLDAIRADPDYEALVSRYSESQTVLTDPPGFIRTTVLRRQVTQTQTGNIDFTRITVTVDGPGLTEPVARTISIGRP